MLCNFRDLQQFLFFTLPGNDGKQSTILGNKTILIGRDVAELGPPSTVLITDYHQHDLKFVVICKYLIFKNEICFWYVFTLTYIFKLNLSFNCPKQCDRFGKILMKIGWMVSDILNLSFCGQSKCWVISKIRNNFNYPLNLENVENEANFF